jgi:hypothetical protein
MAKDEDYCNQPTCGYPGDVTYEACEETGKSSNSGKIKSGKIKIKVCIDYPSGSSDERADPFFESDG